MTTTADELQNQLKKLNIQGPVSPIDLQRAMGSLLTRPAMGIPTPGDDRKDYLAAYFALGPYHRDRLNLQPVRPIIRRPISAPVMPVTTALQNVSAVRLSSHKIVKDNHSVEAGMTEIYDVLPAKTFNPVLRVRLQAIFCRNDDGKLFGNRDGQSKEVLSGAMTKIVAVVNEIFKPQAGIEFVFYPAADLEIVNDSHLNNDYIIPNSELYKLSQSNPLTVDQMNALCDKYSTNDYRNQFASKYPDKMVLLYAEGSTNVFSNNKWTVTSPSGGGFSWEDKDYVKLGAEVGTTDADAHGWVHGFQAHEMGHFYHLHHTFVEDENLYLTQAEYNDSTTSTQQKLNLARSKAIAYIEKHRKEAPNGDLKMLLDGDRGTVTDTPPDEGTHILTFENILEGSGGVCGTDGNISLTLSDGTQVNYSPDRTLAMSYYKGCFDNTFSPKQVERMRASLLEKNRRRLVKTQLGDTGYPGEYVCAVWDPNLSGQVYELGLDANALKAEEAKWKAKGFYITSQQAYTKGGITRYDIILNPQKAAPHIIWGWTVNDFKVENEKQQAGGSGLTHAESYLLPDGQVRMNAIWYPGALHSSWVEGYSQEDFGKVFLEKYKTNQRLIHLNSWNLPGNAGVRYDGIWVSGTYGQYAYADMSAGVFQQKYGEMWQKNFKLIVLDAVRVGNELRYSGVWNYNTGAQYIVWGQTREQIRQAYDEMWNQGMKLKSMSAVLF